MSDLGPQRQNLSYGSLLQVPGGITSALTVVTDGEGNATPLQLSSTQVSITGYVSATAQNVLGGIAGSVLYQIDTDQTGFTNIGSAGQLLRSNGNSAPSWVTINAASVGALPAAGGTMTGNIAMSGYNVTGLGTPVSATDAANKSYVDSVAVGLQVKTPVVAATTANISLSGTQTIDGVAVVAGNRVLVKDQSISANNGIYVASASNWARSSDMDQWAEFVGAYVYVQGGTININSGWSCSVAAGGTLGVTPITWNQFSQANTYSAGAGLQLVGSQFSIIAPVSVALGGTGVTTISGLVKGNGTSAFTAAVAETDYAPITVGTTILAGNGTGGFSNVTVGTGLTYVAGTLTATVNGSSVTVPVSTISALRAVDKLTYQFAYVEGYYAAGDGGGGNYYYDASDTTSADNGGTIIVATDGGRWKLSWQNSVSVKQFGAYDTNINATQTTTAFQNAINWVAGLSYNRPYIYVPVGTYSLNTLTINNQSNVYIKGSGQGSILSFQNSTTANGFQITGASTLFRLDDVWCIGSGSATAGAVISIVSTVNPSAFINNVIVNNGYYGILIDCGLPAANNVFITNYMGNNQRHSGIIDYSGFWWVNGNINGAVQNGIYKVAGNGPNVTGVDIYGCTTGVRIQPSSTNIIGFGRYTNVTCTNGTYGYVLSASTGYVIDTCITGGKGSLCAQFGMLLIGSGVNGVNVNGFEARSNSSDGIVLNGCQNVTICQSNSMGNTGSGIRAAANTSRFTITNNIIGDVALAGNNTQYGVNVQTGTSNYYIITLNQFNGNTAGSLFDGGSGTTKIISNNL